MNVPLRAPPAPAGFEDGDVVTKMLGNALDARCKLKAVLETARTLLDEGVSSLSSLSMETGVKGLQPSLLMHYELLLLDGAEMVARFEKTIECLTRLANDPSKGELPLIQPSAVRGARPAPPPCM